MESINRRVKASETFMGQSIDRAAQQGTVRVNLGRLADRRSLCFASLLAASAVSFSGPLQRLLTAVKSSDEYSYILLIPVFTVGLFLLERRVIFERLRYSLRAGGVLFVAGCGIAGLSTLFPMSAGADNRLCLEILGLATIWIACFVLCYGTRAARAGVFPLLFSLLLTPLPPGIMAKPIALIQHGSADVTGFLFVLFRMPVFRDGLTYSLPGLNFKVATECSGIHSSTALFVASILAGHFWFRSGWKRALLVLCIFPIVCFTNGLRMFVLATLAVYVNPAFFYGNLHHKGGSLFFALALVIVAGLTKLLGGRLHLEKRGRPGDRRTGQI